MAAILKGQAESNILETNLTRVIHNLLIFGDEMDNCIHERLNATDKVSCTMKKPNSCA